MPFKDTAFWVWGKVRTSVAPVAIFLNHSGARGYHRGIFAHVPLTAYCVYRSSNESHVVQFVNSLSHDSIVHLHALDGVSPRLSAQTRSSGPGYRVPLLQSLIDRFPPESPADYVMIFDDDVTFAGSGGARFPALAAAAQLDVAQPAHHPASHASFRITRWEPLSTVRLTTFVEVGPVVLISPSARGQLLPFPSDLQMGWGLDVEWARLRIESGLRLGVVDATPILHHGVVQAAYDDSMEIVIRDEYLRRFGSESPHDIANNVGLTWRPWQRTPKWVQP